MSLTDHKTKIVATIGPASESKAVLESMLRAGLNIARLNFSHGDLDAHRRAIENIFAASQATEQRVAIMADLPGPKIRIGTLGMEKIQLNPGDRFTLTTKDVTGDERRVSVNFPRLPQVVKPGNLLSLNDGYIQLEVSKVKGPDVISNVMAGGELRSRQGLNLPGIDLGIGAFTERDRQCLQFALEHGVDAISQSFVESAADVHAVRKAAREFGGDPLLIAKIERAGALDRLDEILDAADGVMIARGDLGVEVPIERIAIIQKDIMRRANLSAKPVITATQMLESMTIHRLPTRAEATDVANAILDGTDCVMLSGESAVGAFPVEAVAMLARIAAAVEPTRRMVSVKERYTEIDLRGHVRPEHLMAVSVEASFEYLQPAAIFVPSATGASARRMASLHLPVPIVAPCARAKTCQDLMFSYGIYPVNEAGEVSTDYVRRFARAHGLDGEFAIKTDRVPPDSPQGNQRMEVIYL